MMRPLFILLLLCAAGFAQSTVTLNGTTYTLKGHPRTLIDGPGGVIDTAIKDPDGTGPMTAPKANSGNPAWVALGNSVTAPLTNYQTNANRWNYRSGVQVLQFASYWYGDNSHTSARTAALYMLNNIEQYIPLVCVETVTSCVNNGNGYGLTSYGISSWMPNWILAYELMRGQMTTLQRTAFADKILNDLPAWGGIGGAAGTNCANPTVDDGVTASIAFPSWSVNAGTLISLTGTNPTMVATITGSTAGMQVGDSVLVVSLPTVNNVMTVTSINSSNSFTMGNLGVPTGNYAVAGASVTYQKAYATTSGPVFSTTVNSGDWIFTSANNNNLGIVDQIVDSSHAWLLGGIVGPTNDEMYSRSKTWSAGQCGVIWNVKHDKWIPPSLTGGASILYPPDGGTDGSDTGQNLVYSALWGMQMTFLSLIDDDVNASVRSGAEMTTAYSFWYTGPYALAERFNTGFHQSGSGYGIARMHFYMPGAAIAIQNSLISPPAVVGTWAKKLMVLDYANTFPNAQRSQMQWGQPDVSGGFGGMTPQNLQGFVMLAYWYRATPEGAYANWWLQNMWANSGVGFGNTPGSNLGFTSTNIASNGGGAAPWFYIFTDRSYPTASLSGSPTTFPLNVTDTGVAGQRADALISRTGFLSATDTLLDFHAETLTEYDHNVFATLPSNQGSYKIFKGHYLLAEDFGINFSDPSANGFTLGGQGSNYVEVGGSASNINTTPPIGSAIPRATGNNDYAYSMADVTKAYVSGVGLQHGYRHLVDFKLAGTQQFIVDYMDFQTANGETKKAYYHYPNMSGTALVVDTVTSNNTNGNASQLLTKVLAPQPVLIASNRTGTSFRLDVCPTSDGATCDANSRQAEMLVVHMPVAGTGGALPSMHLLSSIDPGFTGIEIDGLSPKVAVFARNGTTAATTSFTAGHTGIAQILIGGVTPTATAGMVYTLTRAGVPVLRHQVVGADGTIYFQGTAGTYQLTAEQAPPAIQVAPLADAVQYQPSMQQIGVTGGSLPLSWNVASGSLPAGLTLDGGSGTLGGTPTAAGTYTFTAMVTDAIGQSDSEVLTLTVDPAPPVTILTTSLTLTAGTYYTQPLTAAGGGGLYTWAISSGSLPAGLNLSNGGGVSGSSLLASSGSVSVTATDQYGNTATGNLGIRIVVLPATQTSGVTVSGLTLVR